MDMINMIEGGEWFGADTKVFRLNQKKGWDDFGARTFADSVSKTKSFRLNQKKGWVRLNFVFLFLEESVWGRAERVVVFCFQKYIYFWELHVSGNYKRLDLTS
jgi:hypothetical protein